jgi:hypothetical protein
MKLSRPQINHPRVFAALFVVSVALFVFWGLDGTAPGIVAVVAAVLFIAAFVVREV